MSTSTEQIVNKEPSWWTGHSALERGLMIMIICAGLVSFALVISLCVVASKSPDCPTATGIKVSSYSRNSARPCMSPACIHTASVMLSNMDRTVDPCDDFYEFACGNFIRNTMIPDDQQSVDMFTSIDDDLQRQLRASLEAVTDKDIKPFRLANAFYQSCMNQTQIEKLGLEPLMKVLRILGGWPVLLDDWNAEDHDWKEYVYQNQNLGYSVNYFLTMELDVDPKNNTRRLIAIDQAWLSVPREFMMEGLSHEIVKLYYDYMVDIAVLLGADKKRAIRELGDVLDFEFQLAQMSKPEEERRNSFKQYNPTTVSEMSKTYPSIPWLEYFNKIMSPLVTVSPDELIVVKEPDFIHELENLLARTPKRVIGNYAVWRIVRDNVDYLTDKLRQRKQLFWERVSGETEREPRWLECTRLVSSALPISVGAMYVRKYFDEDAKNNAMEMVADIRKQFRVIIEKVDWMDEKTRSAAIEKIDAMENLIAYPDELLDDSKLEEYYEKLEISKDALFDNLIAVNLVASNYSLERFRQPVNKTDWVDFGDAAVINAFYLPNENSMQFPAGILQGQFFNKDRPQYMNYGSIGFVIGHEITHGFDDQGSQYDKNGNLDQWWAPQTKEKFLKKAECIIHQYDNYIDDRVGLKLNGINTQGENIADNGGIKEAYMAYKLWVERNGPEPRLPGLDYSPEQMFWVSAANSWCAKERTESLKLNIFTDEHSPSKFRVIGPLSNVPDFAKDFNCPLGSKMNPVKKCVVW
ncbi:hypothetical protein TKK_0014771 [Trichogramma kaykai]|uniref:Membrane metallo-endopeptidase-like 1 n=1 Tax=Trichogramma kaykai TaxID=54128 RepID=A0ABD2WDX7_9HYME